MKKYFIHWSNFSLTYNETEKEARKLVNNIDDLGFFEVNVDDFFRNNPEKIFLANVSPSNQNSEYIKKKFGNTHSWVESQEGSIEIHPIETKYLFDESHLNIKKNNSSMSFI